MFDYLPEVRRGEPITAAMWNTMVRAIRKRTPQAGFGLTSTIGDGGITFSVIPMSEIFGDPLHAWKLVPTTVSNNPKMTVNAGSHNGVAVAKVEELDEGDAYLKVTWNPTINDGYVAPNQTGSVSTREIIRQDAGAAAPSNDTDTNYIEYHYIGTVDGGVVTAQVAKGPISTRVCDDGTSTSVVQFIIDDAGGYA